MKNIKLHVHNLLISFLVWKINVASKNILNSDNSNNMIITFYKNQEIKLTG